MSTRVTRAMLQRAEDAQGVEAVRLHAEIAAIYLSKALRKWENSTLPDILSVQDLEQAMNSLLTIETKAILAREALQGHAE